MTVLAAYIDKDGIAAIAADTEAEVGGEMKVHGIDKLYRLGKCAVGTTGAGGLFFFLNEERYPECGPDDDVEQWAWKLRDRWLDTARERGHGFMDEGMWTVPGALLVVGPSSIYTISGDGLIEERLDYVAIGSGGPIAMGVLWLHWKKRIHDPLGAKMVVVLAANAAIEHAVGCGGRVEAIAPIEGMVSDG